MQSSSFVFFALACICINELRPANMYMCMIVYTRMYTPQLLTSRHMCIIVCMHNVHLCSYAIVAYSQHGCMLNLFIRSLLMMRFNDTQCGAKVIHRSAIGLLFGKPFISKWLFDVELFLRLRKRYGLSKVNTIVYEQPLKRWEHVDGSKISLKDSGTILLQILKVALHYKRHHLSYVSAPIITPSKEVVVVP